MQFTIEKQIERLNHIISSVKQLNELAHPVLTYKSDPKKWNIIEVLDHLNLAYDVYRPQIEQVLPLLSDSEQEQTTFSARFVPRILINMISPKGEERKWKMKTLGVFTPDLPQNNLTTPQMEQVFDRFFDQQAHLKAAMTETRRKNWTEKKIISALGPMVKFYLPECFEFMVAHIERHIVQIKEILREQNFENKVIIPS